MAEITINIDGREIQAEEGLNLIEAARLLGIHIPHFCYHPGLGVDGNCRMCLVEMEGSPKPVIACNTYVRDLKTKDGVRKIYTTTAKVKEWQKAVLEFLFLNHPLDCPICDQSGECFLQDYYMAHGQYLSRLDTPKVHKRKVVLIGPRVMLDAERCVLCARCVRFCNDVTHTGELVIVNRGNRSEIACFPGLPLDNEYSLNTVDLCPVGALTSTDFRFKKRVWLLESVPSLCTGCSRGCNIYLEYDEGIVWRYRPRENAEVNGYWMCDPGRLTRNLLNDGRLESARLGEEEIPLSRALEQAASWIKEIRSADSGGNALVLLSPASSVETIYAAKRFAADVLGGARIAGAGTKPDGVEDQLLRRADPYPNTAGLKLLGCEGDPEPELIRGGSLLVIVEDDPLGPTQRPAWAALARGFSRVLYLGTHECATAQAAGLALPVTPHSECDGSMVNFQGRLQRFRKGLTPRGDALWAPELFRRMAAAAGLEFGWAGFRQLWAELSSGEKAFAGCDPLQLGPAGRVVGEGDGPASGEGRG